MSNVQCHDIPISEFNRLVGRHDTTEDCTGYYAIVYMGYFSGRFDDFVCLSHLTDSYDDAVYDAEIQQGFVIKDCVTGFYPGSLALQLLGFCLVYLLLPTAGEKGLEVSIAPSDHRYVVNVSGLLCPAVESVIAGNAFGAYGLVYL